MIKRIAVVLCILISSIAFSQECNPFYKPNHYELDKNKSASIGYVACLHARGVIAEVGYDRMFLGVLAMGKGHHGATYTFLQYEVPFGRSRLYGGPAYRLNQNPTLIMGRAGADLKIYKRLWATAGVLQINRNLNYLHVGLKIQL